MSIHNKFSSDTASFYFGHQGYEYVDLGRVWQMALMAGLLLWLALVVFIAGLKTGRSFRDVERDA